MNNIKKDMMIMMIVLWCGMGWGQDKVCIYDAFIHGNMEKWKKCMESLEARKGKNNKELLELLNYQYGYIAWCIDKDLFKEAKWYLNKARENASHLEQQQYHLSMIYAYQAAFVGFDIGLAPYKAPFIGVQSERYAKKSIDTDSTNVLGYVQLGNIAFYKPAIFGGSKQDALRYYLKALYWIEKKKQEKIRDWNYLNLLATLIYTYTDIGEYEIAKKYCLLVLGVEPNFDWVKNDLYPSLLKKKGSR